MMSKGEFIVTTGIGGAIAGAVGAAAGDSARVHPILKGALITGAIWTGIATVTVVSGVFENRTNQGSLSGPPLPLRFP